MLYMALRSSITAASKALCKVYRTSGNDKPSEAVQYKSINAIKVRRYERKKLFIAVFITLKYCEK